MVISNVQEKPQNHLGFTQQTKILKLYYMLIFGVGTKPMDWLLSSKKSESKPVSGRSTLALGLQASGQNPNLDQHTKRAH